MSLTAETLFRPYESTTQLSLEMPSDRQADLDAKQALVASLLKETGCEGLLVLEPENFALSATPRQAQGKSAPSIASLSRPASAPTSASRANCASS